MIWIALSIAAAVFLIDWIRTMNRTLDREDD